MPGPDDKQSDIRFWLTLVHAPGIGPATVHQLLEHFESAERIVTATGEKLRDAGLGKDAIASLQSSQQEGIERDLGWQAEAPSRHIIALNSPAYPKLLKQIARPPAVLYVLGDPEVLHTPQLAIVGSRKASNYGCRQAARLSAAASQLGLTICSGLAHGIDAAAHQAAIELDALNVAVTATGLDRVYPAAHHAMAHQISASGALVSEFPVGTNPRPAYFPRRNRIISGLSYGTLVVEANLKSGSLTTAAHATEQSREVFAVPGNIDNPLCRGCHDLLRRGATLVETIDDIMLQLAPLLPQQLSLPETARAQVPVAASAPAGLSDDAQHLLSVFEYEALSFDDLVEKSGLPIESVNQLIIELELNSAVESTLAGGYIRAPN